ncbi:MAG: gamma-glutamylcyclotransferase [SAR324 cluster bacterium]|nr:gamma-glutamylcyclotransferase [SAR324 cluster bacterium]
MGKNMMPVFVYGTLLQGLCRHSALESGEFLGPAMIDATMYDLGFFPGIKVTSGMVIGELYHVSSEVLGRLDDIEGFSPSDHSSSLYIRQEISVRKLCDGTRVSGYVYVYNHSVGTHPVVVHGDYRRYILEKKHEQQWIVAYGSNLSRERLFDRVGNVIEQKKGYLDGYSLVFNKQAGDGNAYANIAFSTEDRCPAVASLLTPEQISVLDQYEGVPTHYVRTSLPFSSASARQIMQVYVAHPDMLVSGRIPRNDYFEHIRTGYREHGFEEIIRVRE